MSPPPTPLRRSRVLELLGGGRFSTALHTLGIVGSTSDLALERGRTGAADGLVVVAEGQSAGRGRRGAGWASPARLGVYASVLLRPAPAPQERLLLPAAAGVAVAEALEGLGIHPTLKFPNDVLVARKKVAGILIEIASDAGGAEFAVLGIGINSGLGRDELPGDAPVPAASLTHLLGRPVPREELLASVLRGLERLLEVLEGGGAASIAGSWVARDALRGATAAVRDGNRVVEGVVAGADPRTGLRLLTAAGEIRIPAAHAQVLSVRWPD